MEARATEITELLAAPAPTTVRLHPNLSEVYRKKVSALAETLTDPDIRTAALDTIRGLITTVTIHERDGDLAVELEGAITAMIDLAQPKAGKHLDGSSVSDLRHR